MVGFRKCRGAQCRHPFLEPGWRPLLLRICRGSTASALRGMPSLPESPLPAGEPVVPHSSLGIPDMKEMVILEAKKCECACT